MAERHFRGFRHSVRARRYDIEPLVLAGEAHRLRPHVGVGPQLYIPTSTDSLLGVGEPGLGPTGIVLVQKGPWTVGGLANQVWSLGSDDIDSLFVQPFLSYNTPTAWTYTLNSESTYDWNTDQWSVPINAKISKLVTIGEQRIQLFGGARYYLESTDDGADGWGARFGVTFLFPEQ